MKILILINAAPEHRPFYAAVGDKLVAAGHIVHFAVDSHFTDYLHPRSPLPADRTHYFSEFFRANRERTEPPAELRDVNLWTVAFPDVERMFHTRFMPGTGRARYFEAAVANLGHFFVDLFDRFQFDAVVYENVSNAFSYAAYEVSRARGARYIGFLPSRLPGRTDVLDRAWARDSALESMYRRVLARQVPLTKEVEDYVAEYIANFDEKVPDYMQGIHPFEMGLISRYGHLRPFQRLYRSIKYGLIDGEDARYAAFVSDPLRVYPEQVGKEVVRQAKRSWLNRRYYATEVDRDRPYFLYPLQLHPESTTSVDGPLRFDEWSNVVNIASCLPFGHQLLVKDHRHAAGRLPMSFYDRVARIPNVTLIHPGYPTKPLIKGAKAVVTVTSTMGYEAIMLGVPAFVLGHPFYDFHPGCRRIESFENADVAFRRAKDVSSTTEERKALVAAYYLTSEAGTLNLVTQRADKATVAWVSEVIDRRVRLPRSHPEGTRKGASDGKA